MTAAFVTGFFMIGSMASLYASSPDLSPPGAFVAHTGTGTWMASAGWGRLSGPYLGGLS